MVDEPVPSESPRFGGTSRMLNPILRGALGIWRSGGLVQYSGPDKLGRGSRAQLRDSGEISWEAKGLRPQGESNTLYVCDILIEALRTAGEEWGQPAPGNHPSVDCEARSTAGGSLKIQVVAAVTRSSFWASFARLRKAGQESAFAGELATQLRESIRKKSDKHPREVKEHLVLAIDSTRTPAHTLGAVIDEFRRSYGDWCITTGFKAVWLVGPYSNMVFRLDLRAV